MSAQQQKLVTLQEWAASKFKRPPSRETLRKWKANIYPRPRRIGGRMMVPENAEYIDPEDTESASSLVDRIRGA
jgi:hypothetical protein